MRRRPGLQAQGVGSERVVALALPRRDSDLVVGLLGILASGAAYLPLDLTYPAERLAFMLADTAPHCVLTTAVARAQVPAGPPVVLLDGPAARADGPGWRAPRVPPRPRPTTCTRPD